MIRLALAALTLVAGAGVPVAVQSASMTLYGSPRQGALVRGVVPAGTRVLTFNDQAIPFAPDGHFIFAFGRDAPPTAVLRATDAQGRTIDLPLTVAKSSWRTELVAGVPRRPLPDGVYQRVRDVELAMIRMARERVVVSNGWRQPVRWPVTGRISGLFGAQRVYANNEAGAPHSGVDVARPTGTPIVAPADGVVTLAETKPFTLEGQLLIVDHGMGLNSAFLHLSRIDVRVGDRVRQGQTIGAIGSTGRSSGPHLHWAMRWRDVRIDPMQAAGPMPTAGR